MKGARIAATVSLVLALGPGLALPAHAQEEPADVPHVGRRWLDRLDPWWGIPEELALPLARAAVAGGMTKGEVARLLNDERFAMAVASGEGHTVLEAMTRDPSLAVEAYDLLFETDSEYTTSGATSFQTALFEALPQLRNEYLSDLGHMVVVRGDGVEVLVDVETGRQVIGQGKLGIQITAPGGGPLPEPSPEEAATTVAAAGPAVQRAGGNPLAGDPPQVDALVLDRGSEPEGDRLLSPGVYVLALLFAIPWLGYAVIAAARRLRRP